MSTKRKPAAKPPARRRQVVPMTVVRREIPKGMAWCGPCGKAVPEKGGERSRSGLFFFCKDHR